MKAYACCVPREMGAPTFLVHPEDSQAKFSLRWMRMPSGQPDRPIIPLKNAIRVLNGFGARWK